jgi:chemotaxis protein histidine kinase CheA
MNETSPSDAAAGVGSLQEVEANSQNDNSNNSVEGPITDGNVPHEDRELVDESECNTDEASDEAFHDAVQDSAEETAEETIVDEENVNGSEEPMDVKSENDPEQLAAVPKIEDEEPAVHTIEESAADQNEQALSAADEIVDAEDFAAPHNDESPEPSHDDVTPESPVLVSAPSATEDNDAEQNDSADSTANIDAVAFSGAAAVAAATAGSPVKSSHSQQDSSNAPIPCYVNPATPIPNSDSSLRLLRKFINKTSKYFPAPYGGTKPTSFMSFVFGGNSYSDECSAAYKHLVDILLADVEDEESQSNDEENDVVIESILGHSGDTMSKARLAMASFCRLVEMWCLETQRIQTVQIGGGDLRQYENLIANSKFHKVDQMDRDYLSSQKSAITGEVMAAAVTCAEGLVAHGCFDGVLLGMVEEGALDMSSDDISLMDDDPTFFSAVSVLCESIYMCFLDSEDVELQP